MLRVLELLPVKEPEDGRGGPPPGRDLPCEGTGSISMIPNEGASSYAVICSHPTVGDELPGSYRAAALVVAKAPSFSCAPFFTSASLTFLSLSLIIHSRRLSSGFLDPFSHTRSPTLVSASPTTPCRRPLAAPRRLTSPSLFWLALLSLLPRPALQDRAFMLPAVR